MESKNKIVLTSIICVGIICSVLIIGLAWVFSPTELKLSIEMDNNTSDIYKLMYDNNSDEDTEQNFICACNNADPLSCIHMTDYDGDEYISCKYTTDEYPDHIGISGYGNTYRQE